MSFLLKLKENIDCEKRTIYLSKKYIFELFCFKLLINLLLVNFFREVFYMKTVNLAIN